MINDIKSNKSYDIKKNAMNILSTMKDDRIFKLFSELVRDQNWMIRFHLVKILDKLSSEDYKDLLIILSEDIDIDVKESAKKALLKY